jgi:hypothetical protein
MATGLAESLRLMVQTHELALTTALLPAVWVSVALSYYGTILFGVELQTQKHTECVDGSAPISAADFKDVFITSLGEARTLSSLCLRAAACVCLCCLCYCVACDAGDADVVCSRIALGAPSRR